MHGTSVADLRGPGGAPTAAVHADGRAGEVRLASGRTVEALTFNGTVPGPELHVRQGDLVEVTLRNRGRCGGVTIHWHGVDVPNAEDGVAGVTQDAVPPGGSYVYRFRAEQVGTFWYHAHQASASEVRRGLYGALVIEPATDAATRGTGPTSWWPPTRSTATPLVNATDGVERRAVAPGTPVRLRLINTDSTPHTLRHRRHAVRGRRDRRHRSRRADASRRPGRSSARGRRPLRRGVHDAAGAREARRGGHARRAGTERRRQGRPTVSASRTGIRPGRVRQARTDAVRRLEPLRPRLRARGRPQARLLRRPAGAAVDDQRRHLPARPDVHGADGRPRAHLDPEHDGRRAPDAPPRPPHARAEP